MAFKAVIKQRAMVEVLLIIFQEFCAPILVGDLSVFPLVLMSRYLRVCDKPGTVCLQLDNQVC